MTTRGRAWASVAMILSAACWGLATVSSKMVLDHLPPFTLLSLQLAGSIGFLWLVVAIQRPAMPLTKQTARGALAGVLEPGLAYGLGVPGLVLTSASNAAIIGAAEPAIVTLLAWLLLGETLSGWRLLSMALASFGVVLVTLNADGAHGTWLGDGLVLGGTAVAALYVLASAQSVRHLAPLPLAALQQTAGFICALLLLAVARLTGFEPPLPPLPWWVLLLALGTGIVQYALAFWFYLLGLQGLPASTAALFLTLIPVFGVGGAWAMLGDGLSLLQLAGCGLVCTALASMAWRT